MDRGTPKDNRLTVIVVLVILALFLFVAIISPSLGNRSAQGYGSLVNLPVAEARVFSSSDGSEHELTASFTVEVEAGEESKIDAGDLHAYISQLMTELDFDNIADYGNVQYIKDEIKSGLEEAGKDDYVTEIYIRDMWSGRYQVITSETQESDRSDGSAVEAFLDALGN